MGHKGWRTKSEYPTLRRRGTRTCRVTITDLEKVSRTVEVTATTLYEAIALTLAALRENDWVAGIPEGLAAVRVTVTSIPIEHTVKMRRRRARPSLTKRLPRYRSGGNEHGTETDGAAHVRGNFAAKRQSALHRQVRRIAGWTPSRQLIETIGP